MSDAPSGNTLGYRPAEQRDAPHLLAWRNDEKTRRQSIHDVAVSPDEHAGWLARTLGDESRLLLIAEQAGEPVAQVRYDRVGEGLLEVSLTVAPQARGRGLAARALQETAELALRHFGASHIRALIRPGNTASRRSFAKAGYGAGGKAERAGVELLLCWWPEAPAKEKESPARSPGQAEAAGPVAADAGWEQQVARFKRVAWTGAGTVEGYVDRTSDGHGISKVKNRLERGFVARHAHGRALDAGCGAGRFTALLSERLGFVVGLDYSGDMLLHTRGLLTRGGHDARLARGDAAALPFPSNTFDSLVSITVLEHFPHFTEMLGEYVRVLAPGGTLIFEMPNALQAPAGSPENPEHFVARLDPEGARELLASLGVELIECMPYDFWNRNEELLQRLRLGKKGRKRFHRAAQRLLTLPGLARGWAAVEGRALRALPARMAPNLLFAGRKRG